MKQSKAGMEAASGGSSPLMEHRRRTTRRALLLAPILLLGISCDLGTKVVARAHLADGPPVPLIAGVLDLHYAENPDIAFNLLAWIPEPVRRPLIIGIGCMAIAGLLLLLWFRLRRDPSIISALCIALIIAGALGNVLDRAIRGYVVDFVYLHGWPVFNVADVLITAGVVMMLFETIRHARKSPLSH